MLKVSKSIDDNGMQISELLLLSTFYTDKTSKTRFSWQFEKVQNDSNSKKSC